MNFQLQASEIDTTADPALPRWVFLHAVRVTVGRTPVWITASALLVALALVGAVPWFGWFDSALAHRYAPGSLVSGLDETFRFDHRASRGAMEAGASSLGGVLAFLAMLVGAFTAGGWLQVFLEHTEGHSVLRFFYGGSRYFFRFLRVLLLTLLMMHLLGWVLTGAPWKWLVLDKCFGLSDGDLSTLGSELTARRIVLLQDGLLALGTAFVFAWGDYTRTRLAAHGTQSVVWAGLCSWTLLFAHPIRALRPLFFLLLVEAGVLQLAGELNDRLDALLDPNPTKLTVFAMLALGLCACVWRSITRGAHYSVCAQITRSLVRPLARPDPWKRSVGGPGGPRYPIETADGDEYGVSL
jgi:hypothetical protein